MPKRPVSVTLDEDNLLWLRGRVALRKRRSLSEAIDEIVTAARTGGALEPSRSVVGTVTINADDPGLDHADAYIRTLVAQSLGRPLAVHEEPATYGAASRKAKPRQQRRRPGRG
jgi:hypothetical protein